MNSRARTKARVFTCLLVLSLIAIFLRMIKMAWNVAPVQAGQNPLLGGTAQIGLLALVLALSAYLRQVYAEALKNRDDIKGSKVWNFPIDQQFSQDRLELLDHTCDMIRNFSPFLLLLGASV